MIKWFKECSDFYRYFKKTMIEEKAITFYAEHSGYFPYLRGLVRELSKEDSKALCYVTSDYNDPILSETGLRTFYLNKLLPWFMAFVNCKVLVMTMTDLNQFHIKRSCNPVHYVYVFHSPVSTHMIYRQKAFNQYDSLLCVGGHQVKEILKSEELYGLKPKELVEAGYYRIEELYGAYSEYRGEDDTPTVLVAPTWGQQSNLLEVCGEALLGILKSEGYKIVLRLHPESVKRGQFANTFDLSGITLETSVVDMDSLVKADILITDWSGIGLEYAFGTERPVIFIDTPPKVRNPRYNELGIEPVESFLRNKIGIVVSPQDIKSIPKRIPELMGKQNGWKDKLAGLRSEYIFNFGRCSEVGASYIRGLL